MTTVVSESLSPDPASALTKPEANENVTDSLVESLNARRSCRKRKRSDSTGSSSTVFNRRHHKKKKKKNKNRNPSTPRVNPIFLWVKQDDTKIVQVLCEDYDRRNRITLTKTAGGWRSIPHSDHLSRQCSSLLIKNDEHESEDESERITTTTTTTVDTNVSDKIVYSSPTDRIDEDSVKEPCNLSVNQSPIKSGTLDIYDFHEDSAEDADDDDDGDDDEDDNRIAEKSSSPSSSSIQQISLTEKCCQIETDGLTDENHNTEFHQPNAADDDVKEKTSEVTSKTDSTLNADDHHHNVDTALVDLIGQLEDGQNLRQDEIDRDGSEICLKEISIGVCNEVLKDVEKDDEFSSDSVPFIDNNACSDLIEELEEMCHDIIDDRLTANDSLQHTVPTSSGSSQLCSFIQESDGHLFSGSADRLIQCTIGATVNSSTCAETLTSNSCSITNGNISGRSILNRQLPDQCETLNVNQVHPDPGNRHSSKVQVFSAQSSCAVQFINNAEQPLESASEEKPCQPLFAKEVQSPFNSKHNSSMVASSSPILVERKSEEVVFLQDSSTTDAVIVLDQAIKEPAKRVNLVDHHDCSAAVMKPMILAELNIPCSPRDSESSLSKYLDGTSGEQRSPTSLVDRSEDIPSMINLQKDTFFEIHENSTNNCMMSDTDKVPRTERVGNQDTEVDNHSQQEHVKLNNAPSELSQKSLTENSPINLVVDKTPCNQVKQENATSNLNECNLILLEKQSEVPVSQQSSTITKTDSHSMTTEDRKRYLDKILNINHSDSVEPTKIPCPIVQREPLNLGKLKKEKSPSPVVHHSKQSVKTEIRVPKTKLDHLDISVKPVFTECKLKESKKDTKSSKLIDLLNPERLKDPLAQLKEILADPTVVVPDPLLVPRGKLADLVANPAIEIPRLLVHSQHESDLVVVSISHLQTMLQSYSAQAASAVSRNKPAYNSLSVAPYLRRHQQQHGSSSLAPPPVPSHHGHHHHQSASQSTKVPSVMDPAAHMFWLPYLGQLEAALAYGTGAQDFISTLAGVSHYPTQNPSYKSHTNVSHTSRGGNSNFVCNSNQDQHMLSIWNDIMQKPNITGYSKKNVSSNKHYQPYPSYTSSQVYSKGSSNSLISTSPSTSSRTITCSSRDYCSPAANAMSAESAYHRRQAVLNNPLISPSQPRHYNHKQLPAINVPSRNNSPSSSRLKNHHPVSSSRSPLTTSSGNIHCTSNSASRPYQPTTATTAKIKVKDHLLDPNARPPLIKLDDSPHPLWHPLFSSQENVSGSASGSSGNTARAYSSPWNWTTPVTVNAD